MWSTKSQQLNSPPSTGWSAPRCCAPSSRQSDSASAAGRSRRRARSGTHAGMPDFTRLVSPVVRRRGERPDPQHGAHLQPAAAGVAHQGAQARQVPAWTMELSAPGKGLVHCMDRAEYEPRPLQGSSTGTCASSQRDDPLQPAGRRGLRDDPQPAVDTLQAYGGDGTEPFFGCFVTGTDSGIGARREAGARSVGSGLTWAGHTRGSPLTRASIIAPGTKMYAYYVVHAAEACVSAAAEAEAAGAAAAATLTANGWHSRVA